nr:FKBP-type peptidyl-prolyl cis-trans isomerase [Bacteriovorax sp. HI3]
MSISELVITDTLIGEGPEPSKGALVFAHYEGFLENGTKFDSSHDRGKPFQFVFGVGRVIKGWDQGLIGMKVGGKRTLHVPAHLAYGDRQIGAFITPNSNLIFHIELLEVRPRE